MSSGMKIFMIALCFVVNGVLTEVWDHGHYDLEEKWTSRVTLTDR